jgi:hypothetical protein
MGEYFKVLFTI